MIDEKTKNLILGFQRNEITEHLIYLRLASLEKDSRNREVLREIAGDELRHYGLWRRFTGCEVPPNLWKVFFYVLIARIFGVTFAIKLMEEGEEGAEKVYDQTVPSIPEAKTIRDDENKHEKELITMIDEERLRYIGSMVLGLNDALVELTGTLAGLTFALQNTKLVGVAGLITGIAASLSMAASEYLSTKTEVEEKNPLRASLYTGMTYILAVTILIFPFLLLTNPFLSLGMSFLGAVLLIYLFTFYFSVVRGVSFKKRFFEMLFISMGVAGLSFLIGLLVRYFLGVEV
jgi:VIT1/CCC1 family predicted Fe2+/Mn2+ transporter